MNEEEAKRKDFTETLAKLGKDELLTYLSITRNINFFISVLGVGWCLHASIYRVR